MLVISKRYYKTASIKETPSGRCGQTGNWHKTRFPLLLHSIRKAFFIMTFQLKHGQTANGKISPEHKAWAAIKQRCYNPNASKYKYWGGRGITVCERWLNSFENFLADMGKRPSDKHSLDRFPNKEGNYEPGNCRWATIEQQNENRSNNVIIEYNGEKYTQRKFIRFIGTHPPQFQRLLDSGKTINEIALRYLNKKHGCTLAK